MGFLGTRSSVYFPARQRANERDTQTDRGVLHKLPCQLPKLCCRRYVNTASIAVLEEWYCQEETEVLTDNPLSVPRYPTQTSHRAMWDGNFASAVGGRQMTACRGTITLGNWLLVIRSAIGTRQPFWAAVSSAVDVARAFARKACWREFLETRVAV
jgi:hypothetical protein